MEKFTASNGISVANLGGNWDRTELLFEGQSHPSNPERRRTRTFDDEDFLALREFFLHERDQELGRWRDPENPDYVVYDTPDGDGDVLVLNERSGITGGYYSRQGVTIQHYTKFDEVAYDYFAAHPEPKPWHHAKHNEIWVLFVAISEEAYRVDGSAFVPVNHPARVRLALNDSRIRSARRIWPEEEK